MNFVLAVPINEHKSTVTNSIINDFSVYMASKYRDMKLDTSETPVF